MERRAGEMRALLAPDAAERAAAFGASLALDLAFGAGRHTVLE